MLSTKLAGKNIILASQSPRRQDLLKGLEVEFEIRTKDIEEDYPDHLKKEQVARFLAQKKANAFVDELEENDLLITSDTTVCVDELILNKPLSFEEATGMLKLLRNRTHVVVTAVALTSKAKQVVFHDQTEVTFGNLTDQEIEHYITVYKPFDKAGSYGAQNFLGYIGITKLSGSYFNVMGFPLHRVYEELMKF